jgi:hypothetical protein
LAAKLKVAPADSDTPNMVNVGEEYHDAEGIPVARSAQQRADAGSNKTNPERIFMNTMTKLADVVEPESNTRNDAGLRIRGASALVLRYGLVLVIGWIGLMELTGYEAKGIQPLVTHSPFMGWMYSFLSVQAFSDVNHLLPVNLGVVEVTIAILIGLRHWSAKASALGSAAAVIMFLTTLSFLFSAPRWEPSLVGFLRSRRFPESSS